MPNTIRRPGSVPQFLVSIAFAVSLAACASAPLERPDDAELASADGAPASEVAERDEWFETVRAQLAESLCEENEIFRACFPIAGDACHERARAAAEGCEARFSRSIPVALNESSADHWGGEIGRCTGEGLYQELDASFPMQATEACDQILESM